MFTAVLGREPNPKVFTSMMSKYDYVLKKHEVNKLLKNLKKSKIDKSGIPSNHGQPSAQMDPDLDKYMKKFGSESMGIMD